MKARDFIYQQLLNNPSKFPTKWHLLTEILLACPYYYGWNNGEICCIDFFDDIISYKNFTEEKCIDNIDFFYDILRNDVKDYISKDITSAIEFNYNLVINNIKNMKYSVLETEVPNDIIIDYDTFTKSCQRILQQSGKYIKLPEPTRTALIYKIPDNITDDWKQEIIIFYNAVIKPAEEKYNYYPFHIKNIF